MKVRELVGEELTKFTKLREAIKVAERKTEETHTAFQNSMEELGEAKNDLYKELKNFPFRVELSDCGKFLIEG